MSMKKNFFGSNYIDQTELVTVSKLFCVEDSKTNHGQKQTGYIFKKMCQLFQSYNSLLFTFYFL